MAKNNRAGRCEFDLAGNDVFANVITKLPLGDGVVAPEESEIVDDLNLAYEAPLDSRISLRMLGVLETTEGYND